MGQLNNICLVLPFNSPVKFLGKSSRFTTWGGDIESFMTKNIDSKVPNWQAFMLEQHSAVKPIFIKAIIVRFTWLYKISPIKIEIMARLVQHDQPN